MPTTCEIEFENNPSKVVYSGQLLRGSVNLLLTNSKTVRGVFIKIRGEGYCHWSTGSGKNKNSYTGKEDYLEERTYFMGGREGEVRLTPGSYNYTFQCALPSQLPTSFEGGYGHIRYSACVVLDILMWPNKEFEVAFTVLRSLDLNSIPALREPEPVIAEEHKVFNKCCLLCCFKSNPLDINVRVPFGGYTPGQTINVQIKAINESDQPVSQFTVQLIKHVCYQTNASSYDKKLVAIVVCEGITQGCDLNSNINLSASFVVPAISPTDNTSSKIIKFEYSIRVIASVAAFHINPTLNLPIVIGSIPVVYNNDTPAPSWNFGSASKIPTNAIVSQQPFCNNA